MKSLDTDNDITHLIRHRRLTCFGHMALFHLKDFHCSLYGHIMAQTKTKKEVVRQYDGNCMAMNLNLIAAT